MSEYPEHDKLDRVLEESQAIGAFLENMGDNGIALGCEYARLEREE